jgi:hypothetical protein
MPTVADILRQRNSLIPSYLMGVPRSKIINKRGYEVEYYPEMIGESAGGGGSPGTWPEEFDWMGDTSVYVPSSSGSPYSDVTIAQPPESDYGGGIGGIEISTGLPATTGEAVAGATTSNKASPFYAGPKPTEVAKSIYDITRQQRATMGRPPSEETISGITKGAILSGLQERLNWATLNLSKEQLAAQVLQWGKQLDAQMAEAHAQGMSSLFGTGGSIGGYLLGNMVAPGIGGPVGAMIGGAAGGILGGLF